MKIKLAAEKMCMALEETQAFSRKHGYDKLTEEDVVNIMKEAMENYKAEILS